MWQRPRVVFFHGVLSEDGRSLILSVASPIIEHVIEVRELNQRDTLVEAEATLAEQLRLDGRQLALAAHWADLHHPDSLLAPADEWEVRRRRLDGHHAVRPGGEGTPQILASCPAELGLVLQTTAGGAKHLIADALDLRHRLPSLWAEVQEGQVRAWKARRVAQATRHLPLAVMADLDAGLTGLIPSLSWSRFETVLDATVMRADPVGARLAEAEAGSRRFVALGRDDSHGLKTLIARGEVLDILTFLAAVNRIADILAADGDTDTVEVRRSKAVGILGQPDRAIALLTAHQHDSDHPAPPSERAPRTSQRRPSSAADQDREPDEPDESDSFETDSFETDTGVPKDQHAGPTDHVEPLSTQHEDDEPDRQGSRSLDLSRLTSTAGSTSGVRVQLYVHLTDAALRGTDPTAVCRVEGVGPVTASTVRSWLRSSDARITVRPVTVPGEAIPVDGYEIPHRVREAVLLRDPGSSFPWSWCTNRLSLQLDHVRPWIARQRGGPPGQTDPANLAPLSQPEHQRKTSGRWGERTAAPGVCLWRSPHGWITLVTNQGTFPLGTDARAQAMWQATAPRSSEQQEQGEQAEEGVHAA